MISQSQIDFMHSFGELNLLTRRDVTQGVRLTRYGKQARSMLDRDPVCGNTLLGLLACLEHDIDAMHRHHKRAIGLSESCFPLIYYAVSLEKCCFWNEAVRFALLALDYDPANHKILESLIKLVPLTGRFSLFKRLLPQWEGAEEGRQHPCRHDQQAIADLLAGRGLSEQDLKQIIAAIGAAISETDIIIQGFRYDILPRQHDVPFLHYRFLIPDDFAATYYEDLVIRKLETIACHPRIFDAFSVSIENAAVYELYECMEQECQDPEGLRLPDPEKMKLIEELVRGVRP